MNEWEERLIEQRSVVRLLIDENLPESLKFSLADLFPASVHVRDRDIDLAHSPDASIWEYAKAFNFAILTKDSDFADRARAEGPPPTVVQVRVGNCSVAKLVSLIRANAALITTAVQFGGDLCEVTFARAATTPETGPPAR